MAAIVTTQIKASSASVQLATVDEIAKCKFKIAIQIPVATAASAQQSVAINISVNALKASKAQIAKKTSTIVMGIHAKMAALASIALTRTNANARRDLRAPSAIKESIFA
jgi:hypothetical protein